MPRQSDSIQKIDKLIGKRIQELRIAMGLSRQELVKKVGVTHQQLQKYENGTNRISIGRLFYIAKALKKPMSYFLDNLDEDSENIILPDAHQRMAIEVSRNFMCISNVAHQDAVNLLVRTLADKKE